MTIKHYIPKTTLTDYTYLEKREEEEFASNQDSVNASIQRHEGYIVKQERGLIIANRNDTDTTINDRMTTTRKHK